MAPLTIPKDEPGAVKQTGPQLFSILNVVDFEKAASQVLPPKAFACELHR